MAWNGRVQTVTRSWHSVVLDANPDFYADRTDELFYQFSNGREFRGNPNGVGVYTDPQPVTYLGSHAVLYLGDLVTYDP